jgi:hypothetical protein
MRPRVAAPTALTSFAWSIPALHRIELYIEPWNLGGHRRDMLLYPTIRQSRLTHTSKTRPSLEHERQEAAKVIRSLPLAVPSITRVYDY